MLVNIYSRVTAAVAKLCIAVLIYSKDRVCRQASDCAFKKQSFHCVYTGAVQSVCEATCICSLLHHSE